MMTPPILTASGPEPEAALVDDLADLDEALNFAPQPISDGTAVLRHDGYDVRTWQNMLRDFPDLDRLSTQTQGQLPTGAALTRDVAWSLHKRVAALDPLAPLQAAYQINQQILEEMQGTTEWQALRAMGTPGDALLTAMATMRIVPQAVETLDPATRRRLQALADADQRARTLRQQAEMLDHLAQEMGGDGGTELIAQAAAARERPALPAVLAEDPPNTAPTRSPAPGLPAPTPANNSTTDQPPTGQPSSEAASLPSPPADPNPPTAMPPAPAAPAAEAPGPSPTPRAETGSPATEAQALQAQAAALHRQAAAAQAQATRAATQLAEGAEARGDAIRRAVRPALAQATAEVEQMQAALDAFAGTGYGTHAGAGGAAAQPLDQKMDLARQLLHSPRLQQIARMCGRMKEIAMHVQRTKTTHAPDEIAGIRLGDDLALVLPSEFSRLAEPSLEDGFYADYTQQKLIQYEVRSYKKQGQGPIILALDESGSMSGERDTWAKAVTLAFLLIAGRQKRDMTVLHFSGPGNLTIHQFPQGRATTGEIVTCMEHFFGGGTVFDGWMTEALHRVNAAQHNKADVICVTDGVAGISPAIEAAWQQARQEREMRAYGVLIGSQEGAGLLGRVSDALCTLDNLRDEGDLATLQTIFAV